MSGKALNVLFLCAGNSARSILAEVLLEHWGKGRFKAYSAGSSPKGRVHPLALALLEERGLPMQGLSSKSWEEFARPGAPQLDFLVTLCDEAAGEVCPIWPGKPVCAHWGLRDPAAARGTEEERKEAFREAFQQIEERIRAFIALASETRDPQALEPRAKVIGRGVGEGAT